MEKIQFGNYGDRYGIESIQPVAVHVLRIIYTGTMPDGSLYSEPIIIYSQGDIREGTLEGWNTIYAQDPDNRTVYLSDDGSVYTEPEETEPEPEPEPYEPSIEELSASKVAEMEAACLSTIKAGIDVDGEHFSLTTEAQLALITRQHRIDAGETEIDFYADGEPSKFYTAEEMQGIIDSANDLIDFNEVYCNELCIWIKSLTDADAIDAVYYGMDIPAGNRSEVLEKMLPVGDDETGMLPEEGKEDDSGDDSGDDDTTDDTNVGAGGELDVGGND